MLLLKNATIYPQTDDAPFVGDVLCEDGKIVKIGADLSAEGAQVMDLTGLHLLPGLVDSHSHAGLAINAADMGITYATETTDPINPHM